MELVYWPLIGGQLHLVLREGDWAGPRPLLAVPNVTAHPSTACVPIVTCLLRVRRIHKTAPQPVRPWKSGHVAYIILAEGSNVLLCWNYRILRSSGVVVLPSHSFTHSLTSRPSSMRVGDSRRPLRYLSSPLCSIL